MYSRNKGKEEKIDKNERRKRSRSRERDFKHKKEKDGNKGEIDAIKVLRVFN